MESPLILPPDPNDDPFNVDSLRLPPEMLGNLSPKKRLPRPRQGDSFIAGPIPYSWISGACKLSGVGLHVAMCYQIHAKVFPQKPRWGAKELAKGLTVSLGTARRGIHLAEQAGLVVVKRRPGCKPIVSILNPSEPKAERRRPLYGPIPWRTWFIPACRLPGKSLQVGMVCWLLAGWEDSAEIKLALGGWGEFGLSRFSIARGLAELERAGLTSAFRMSGRSPVVTILDPGDGQTGGGMSPPAP
jgi:hypothetical protein